jgi:hypothetical protein
VDLTVVEPRDTGAATVDVEVATGELDLTVVGTIAGATRARVELGGIVGGTTTEEAVFELGGGGGAAEELGESTGAKEATDMLNLGGGGTVAIVAKNSVEPRITVPISLLSGTGCEYRGGEFLQGGPPISTPVVFEKITFPSAVTGIGGATGAACLIAVFVSVPTLSLSVSGFLAASTIPNTAARRLALRVVLNNIGSHMTNQIRRPRARSRISCDGQKVILPEGWHLYLICRKRQIDAT